MTQSRERAEALMQEQRLGRDYYEDHEREMAAYGAEDSEKGEEDEN
jgi:hypothetical protein